MDEGRFGLKTWFRRRWCPRGVRPPWIVHERYEWLWLYGAVEPQTGQSVLGLLPHLNATCFQAFLSEISRTFLTAQEPGRLGLILDNAPAHRSQVLQWPEGISPIPLPAYSPELNPVEQVFRHLRKRLANRIYENLEQLEEAITLQLSEFWENPQVLVRLTGYPWWIQQTQQIPPRTP